ncbi:GGDEF domain-containing protein [Salibacterium qingdaonense]|uniref:Diguanylate cyclase (GGDEF) domain-containing protein n=1 Tax=Salibacterium qingdaonense TaxID=266892 RepID=A0A1I4QKE2_9BACI|nr:GGDEF domain-containing protein [Salibacterium qingdaonense]SFM40083.1 diguanylate cyclase (GGDEF) domain-containing protein [Salibacterium qingdaonense]
MINSFIVSFSLLFTCTVLINYVLYLPVLRKPGFRKMKQVILGVSAGITCILLMMNAYQISENVLLSFFHIPITYTALFYSPLISGSTVITAALGRYFFNEEDIGSMLGTNILIVGTLLIGLSFFIPRRFLSFIVVSTAYTIQNILVISFLTSSNWDWGEGLLYITACTAASLLFYYVLHKIIQFFVMNRQYKERSKIDGLTGVYNRHELEKFLEYLNVSGHRFAVMMIDVDNFKSFNDEFGHHIGDRVLIETAGRINETIREQGSVYRYGGEEFVVILEDQTNTSAYELTESLLSRMQVPFTCLEGEETWNMTVSIGTALPADGFETPKEVVERADALMFEAKKSGKNKAVVCVK